VHKFDLTKRKTEKLVDGASRVAVSDNGEKMLFNQKDDWFLVGTGQPAKPGEGALKLDGLEVRVDPRAEWRQIYREVFRIQRDFLYDPNFHGYDLAGAWAEHAPLLEGLGSRHDLKYLLAVNGQELRGEDEVYRLFEGTAGRQTLLKVGPSADGAGSREVTVVPVGNERALRNLAWVDANRRTVDKLTNGKVAYIYLPD